MKKKTDLKCDLCLNPLSSDSSKWIVDQDRTGFYKRFCSHNCNNIFWKLRKQDELIKRIINTLHIRWHEPETDLIVNTLGYYTDGYLPLGQNLDDAILKKIGVLLRNDEIKL